MSREPQGVQPYEWPCGCYLRVLPDGSIDQLTCEAHARADTEAFLRKMPLPAPPRSPASHE